jgi:hypothetical protein
MRRGVAAVYLVVAMVAMFAVCSLGADLGRVQVVKTELRRAADAAARAGASVLLTSGSSTARDRARSTAALNKADGQPIVLNPSTDVEFGTWDAKTKRFTKLSGFDLSKADTIRVVAGRTTRSGNAVPLAFGQMIGKGKCDVSAEAIVMVVAPVNVNETVQATANPFLAGMPKGSVASLNNPHDSPDYAGDAKNPRQSPFPVKGMPLVAGAALTFDSIAGTARHDPSLPYFSPDGELSDIGRNTNGSENGISDLTAPINALVGVFLTDEQPNRSAAPKALDFRSPTSREFSTLQPQLKQLFFIGDGKTKDGRPQEFIVPEGATRLYLATWDFYEWNNNAGWREVKIARPQRLVTVK